MAFVNLHVHTEGSLLDGMCRVKNLVPYIKELGQSAIAITDHGTMYSYLKFYKLCKKEGIKPIIGLEVYIVPDMKEHIEIQTLAKADKTIKIKEEFNRRASELPSHFGNSSVVMDADGQISYKFGMGHLILLAKNNNGLNNLFQIATHAQLEGMYNRPRIDLEYIRTHSDGLIALSACRAGTIPRLILRQEFELAKAEILKHQEIFENFYLEIQPAECVEQRFVNAKLIEFSAEMNVPLVCTADSHYLKEEDALDHEVLLAVQTASTMSNPNRFKFDANIYYVYSEEQMRNAGMPEESIQNTQIIADMCQIDIELGKPLLPKIEVPKGYTLDSYLSKLCYNNLYKYYAKGLIEDIDQALDRMAFELDVMSKKGISGYELIVYDFINFARKNGIPTGPGRGSGAGSIVNYVLGITDVNPLRYDLLFQRFISIDRPGFPDIDSDIAEYVNLSDFGIKSGREQVYEYLVGKYGKEYTSQIITFGKMKAKAALKDIGRALSVPYDEINSINKFIPSDAGKQWTLEECLKGRDESPAISEIVQFAEKYPDLFRVALKLEDMPRHTSVHAAGVVIAPQPVSELIPLSLASKESSSEKIIVTQLDMNELEEIGILKFDLLGLKTLGVIDRAIKLINKNHNLNLKSSDIDNDDASALALIKKGDTLGVFQIESSGMTEMFTSMKRLRFVDIVAGISLYRPGPMDFIPSYISRLNGKEEIEYMFPQMEPILKETFGIIVYQEQLMKIATDLAGFSKSDSDNYRKATGKKIIEKIKEMNQWLVYGHQDESKGINIPGMVPQGYDEDKCLQLADQLVNFGKYSFNKAHAVAYAMLTIRTAFLKANFPTEFFIATISSYIGSDKDNIIKYVEEARRLGIQFLPPDINESEFFFTEEKDGIIRFGLAAINKMFKSAHAVITERYENGKYADLYDFLERAKPNKITLDALVLSGALDELTKNTVLHLETIEESHMKTKSKRTEFDFLENTIKYYECTLNKALKAEEGFSLSYDFLKHHYALVREESMKLNFSKVKEDRFELLQYLYYLRGLGIWVPDDELIPNLDTRVKITDEFNSLLLKANVEKAYLNIYLSGHPLDSLGGDVDWSSPGSYEIPCIVHEVRIIKTKKGDSMAFAKFETKYGIKEFTIFPRIYEYNKNKLEVGGLRLMNFNLKWEDKYSAYQHITESIKYLKMNTELTAEELCK